jgi:hypothetical protein
MVRTHSPSQRDVANTRKQPAQFHDRAESSAALLERGADRGSLCLARYPFCLIQINARRYEIGKRLTSCAYKIRERIVR